MEQPELLDEKAKTFGDVAMLLRSTWAQPGKSVGAPLLAANSMMDGKEAVGIT